MRATLRLLAAVQKGTQFLEPGAPTGITGLTTVPGPRTSLLYIYSTTLEKLKELPESSVYRQSTEALTKHRMSIVESTKPAGLEEWQQRVKPIVDAHPDVYRRVPSSSGSQVASSAQAQHADSNIAWRRAAQLQTQFGADQRYAGRNPSGEDGYDRNAYKRKPMPEGPQDEDDVPTMGIDYQADPLGDARVPEIEAEPGLTIDQIGEMENKIGAGLIEEVIAVAEGELSLAQTMIDNKVWEDLEEKPVEGQWTYFER